MNQEEEMLVSKLTKWFTEQKTQSAFPEVHPEHVSYMKMETALLFELISIFELTKELQHYYNLEDRHGEPKIVKSSIG